MVLQLSFYINIIPLSGFSNADLCVFHFFNVNTVTPFFSLLYFMVEKVTQPNNATGNYQYALHDEHALVNY